MNISSFKCRGRQKVVRRPYRGSAHCVNLILKTCVEIIVNDENLDHILKIIHENTRT